MRPMMYHISAQSPRGACLGPAAHQSAVVNVRSPPTPRQLHRGARRHLVGHLRALPSGRSLGAGLRSGVPNCDEIRKPASSSILARASCRPQWAMAQRGRRVGDGGTRDGRPQPKVHSEPIAEALPSIPLQIIEPFPEPSAGGRPAPPDGSATIVATETSVPTGTGDTVSPKISATTRTLAHLSPRACLEDPQTREAIAWEAAYSAPPASPSAANRRR